MNLDTHVMGGGRRIRFEDCTLREGEQSADVNLTNDEKVELARLLVDIGVTDLEYGCPGQSPADMLLAERIRADGIEASLTAICHGFNEKWREQIDETIAARPDLMNIVFPSSDIRLEKVLKMSREEALQRCRDAFDYAARKTQGTNVQVGFIPSDTTRGAPEHIENLARVALEGGARSISVIDTVGAVAPERYRDTVARVRAVVGDDMPIRVHCHDDFGFALVNTVAGVQAGATTVNCTINGIGERNGIASIAELSVALEELYGYETGIALSRLRSLSDRFAALTGVPTPRDRPLVGDYAHTHKLDAHVLGVMRQPDVYEPYPAERVGSERHFALGKYSGINAIRYMAEEAGVEVPSQNQIPFVIAEIERVAAKNKTRLTPEDFRQIVSNL